MQWSYQCLHRLTSGVNTAGRNLIWLNYLQFIEEHPHFGNGSQKLWMRSVNANKGSVALMHAHNSLLQFLASHGIWITLLYLAFYFWLWKRKNAASIFAIVVYSVFQFGWGWGFSLLDVMLVYFLIHEAIDENGY
jgi:hypothetical protein